MIELPPHSVHDRSGALAGALILLTGELQGRVQACRLLAGAVPASAVAGVLMFLLWHHFAAAVPAGIVAYFAVLFSFERSASPMTSRW
jgi:hypothetical protein